MRRPYNATARLLACLLMQCTIATAGTPFFLDPQTTHTNGMPTATSDPVRDADTVRACSRDHVGCCGGRYNNPYANSLFHPNRCENYRTPWPLDDHTIGSVLAIESAPPLDNGVENERFVRLGPAPNVQPAAGGNSPNGPAAGLPTLLGR